MPLQDREACVCAYCFGAGLAPGGRSGFSVSLAIAAATSESSSSSRFSLTHCQADRTDMYSEATQKQHNQHRDRWKRRMSRQSWSQVYAPEVQELVEVDLPVGGTPRRRRDKESEHAERTAIPAQLDDTRATDQSISVLVDRFDHLGRLGEVLAEHGRLCTERGRRTRKRHVRRKLAGERDGAPCDRCARGRTTEQQHDRTKSSQHSLFASTRWCRALVVVSLWLAGRLTFFHGEQSVAVEVDLAECDPEALLLGGETALHGGQHELVVGQRAVAVLGRGERAKEDDERRKKRTCEQASSPSRSTPHAGVER